MLRRESVPYKAKILRGSFHQRDKYLETKSGNNSGNMFPCFRT
jgi:hypothetical protein